MRKPTRTSVRYLCGGDRHRDTDHTWEDHVSRDYGRWTIHLQLNLSPRGRDGPYNYGGGYKELGPTHTPALFNLRDTIPLYGLSEDASWWWEAHYIFWTTNSRQGGFDFVKSGYVMSRNTHMVPRHCTTPPAPTPTPTPTPTPAPLCQFVGGFRSLVQNSQTGTCHKNEQPALAVLSNQPTTASSSNTVSIPPGVLFLGPSMARPRRQRQLRRTNPLNPQPNRISRCRFAPMPIRGRLRSLSKH